MTDYLEYFKICLKKNEVQPRKYKQYEFIISDLETDVECIFIESGTIRMIANSSNGKIFNLQYLKGDFLIFPFQDATSIDGSMYTFQVVTDEATIFKISKKVSTNIMKNCIYSNLYIFSILRKQVSFMFAKLNDFSSNGKLGALCGQLLILGYDYGNVSKLGIKITLTITNEELGNFSGITHTSSVNRLLSKLKKEKVIKIVGHKIYIIDLNFLQNMAPNINEWFSINRKNRFKNINNNILK